LSSYIQRAPIGRTFLDNRTHGTDSSARNVYARITLMVNLGNSSSLEPGLQLRFCHIKYCKVIIFQATYPLNIFECATGRTIYMLRSFCSSIWVELKFYAFRFVSSYFMCLGSHMDCQSIEWKQLGWRELKANMSS
jgi:hypothetical protein